MAGVNDGIYRITLDGRQILTAASGSNVVLLPEQSGQQEWQVQRADNETWVIRQANSPRFLGFDGEPETFERVQVLPRPREWRITDGPEPGTFTLGVPDNQLTLGLHPALIYPPLLALSPIFGEDRGWSFESIE
ncbi:hypothetical protein [Frankia sp. ACN1ag]|uniref:hypothetical protein n=1 Tax=Frankia sp. ACN1ag TaxID=102891 RepID=UPI0006DCCA84|nr:hypothetical protein [Frankia sp. ACN1ag]KQC38149.1 hypothetical protein UK82_12245 [Frankia sp. ACN1ag]